MIRQRMENEEREGAELERGNAMHKAGGSTDIFGARVTPIVKSRHDPHFRVQTPTCLMLDSY